jgi:hypothetical protein
MLFAVLMLSQTTMGIAFAQDIGESILPNLKPVNTRERLLVTLSKPMGDVRELYALEDEMIAALEISGVGNYDGDERAVDGSSTVLYFYGDKATDVLGVVTPILRKYPFGKGAIVEMRVKKGDGSEYVVQSKIE